MWPPRHDGAVLADTRPILIRNPGFETDFRVLFGDLFREMARQSLNLPHDLETKIWEQRFRTTFGSVISSRLFTLANRGKAFNVLFQRKHGVLVWNFITYKGRPYAGYLVVVPIDENLTRRGLLTCLSQWRRTFAEDEVYPAFLPYPTAPGPSKRGVLLHPYLRSAGSRKLLAGLFNSMRIIPGRNKGLGRPYLLADTLGRVVKSGLTGDWSLRFLQFRIMSVCWWAMPLDSIRRSFKEQRPCMGVACSFSGAVGSF